MKNKAAQALGRLNRGVRKKLTEKQKEACRARLEKIRHLRWNKKD